MSIVGRFKEGTLKKGIFLAIVASFSSTLYAAQADPLTLSIKTITKISPVDLADPGLVALPADGSWIKAKACVWSLSSGQLLLPAQDENCPVAIRVEKERLWIGDSKIEIKKHKGLDSIISSPDGKKALLLYGSNDGGDFPTHNVELMDVGTGKVSKITKQPAAIAEFSPDSKFVVTDGAVRENNSSSTHLAFVDTKGSGVFGQILFRPSCTQVLGWSKDGKKVMTISYSSWLNPELAVKNVISVSMKQQKNPSKHTLSSVKKRSRSR